MASDVYNFKNKGPQRRWKAFTPFCIGVTQSQESFSYEEVSGLASNMEHNLCCSAAEKVFLDCPEKCSLLKNSSYETLNIVEIVKLITWNIKKFCAASTPIKSS